MLKQKATWVKMHSRRIRKKWCSREGRSKRDVKCLEGDTTKSEFNAAQREQQIELHIPEGLCVQQNAQISC